MTALAPHENLTPNWKYTWLRKEVDTDDRQIAGTSRGNEGQGLGHDTRGVKQVRIGKR